MSALRTEHHLTLVDAEAGCALLVAPADPTQVTEDHDVMMRLLGENDWTFKDVSDDEIPEGHRLADGRRVFALIPLWREIADEPMTFDEHLAYVIALEGLLAEVARDPDDAA